MSIIILLIGFSLLVAVIFLFSFLWAVKNGQYEDRYTPSVRILFENEITDTTHGEDKKSLDKKKSKITYNKE